MTAPFSTSYLAGEPRALRLLPADFRDRDARIALTRRRAGRPPAPDLLGALREQDLELSPSAARKAHIAALSAGAAAVVTGQQAGLFLGPLYTLYKAASAIVTARALAAEAGVPCVPVFWLQTEDHDWAEIDHCHVLRPGAAPLRLELAADGASARASIAHRHLGDDVRGVLGQLEEALGDLPHAPALLELVSAHYRPGAGVASAFAGLLSALFAEEGLIVLDPRRQAIARLCVPVYRQALLRADAIDEALQRRGEDLRRAGFEEQVPVRPGTSLLFYHLGAACGPRHRLERVGPRFVPAGAGPADARPLTSEDLLQLLDREPLRFSTSALLRPLVQDTLLPTVVYLGGPGELSYLAQTPPLYALFDVPPPLFAPRARLRCLEENTRALLGKLGLKAKDAERPRDELRLGCATALHPGPEEVRRLLLADLGGRLMDLGALDPALREPAQQALQSIERTVGKLADRYGRVMLERDRVTTERVDRLRQHLFPEGVPQERLASFLSFAARHGARAFTERVLAAVRPLETAVLDLDL